MTYKLKELEKEAKYYIKRKIKKTKYLRAEIFILNGKSEDEM